MGRGHLPRRREKIQTLRRRVWLTRREWGDFPRCGKNTQSVVEE
jgi:hypothetical protein